MLRSKKSTFIWNGPKGPDGPKRVLNGQKHLGWPFESHLDPFLTTLERCQACHVKQFLVQNGPCFGHPKSWTVDTKVKKVHHQVSYVWPDCRTTKPFGTKIWPQSMKNIKNRQTFHEKMAIFCHEWQVMGLEQEFYSYLVPVPLLWPAEWNAPASFRATNYLLDVILGLGQQSQIQQD